MNKQIKFKEETFFQGYNGFCKCSGLDIQDKENGEVVISAISYSCVIDPCYVTIPKAQIYELRNILGEFCSDEVRAQNAANYLCDNDEGHTISDQVRFIEEHAKSNPNDMIDDVEHIVVWQPVSYKFTCIEFLDLIN